MKNRFEMNLCEGNLVKQILIFSFPIIISNILQLLFNAADIAVVGRFSPEGVGTLAQAAVGSTGSLVQLIISLFVGLSTGSNVIVSRCVGENNTEKARKVVGISILISIIFGIALAIIGVTFARKFLILMRTPDDCLDYATLYIRIYFLGMPIMMLYNYASSILRAVGDTFRPLLYLTFGGVVNVILNIIFVKFFHMTVDGVATATIISQTIAATLAVITLLRSDGYSKFELKYFKIFKEELIDMIKIGLPAGIQGSVFSISNVIIQSAINSFSSVVVAGNTVGGNIEGFIYNAMNGISISTLSFVSQNLGAKKLDRVKKSVIYSLIVSTVMGIIIGSIIMVFCVPLCSIYNTDPNVIAVAQEKLLIMCSTYFTCGFMEILSNALRGVGKSTTSMIISLTGSCLLRIIFIFTIFVKYKNLTLLYIIYPISWFITSCIHATVLIINLRKINKKLVLSSSVS